jgi:cytochrome c-type biogenesis protein CcmH
VPKFLRLKHLGYAVLLLLGFLLLATPTLAQDSPVTDDDVNAVARGLYCPVCESTPLDVCATKACADWRELIRQQLSEGKTQDEIHEYFALQYGNGVLAEPPKRGFNLILWLFPVVALVLGGFLFSRFMRKLRATAVSEGVKEVRVLQVKTPPTQPSSQEDYRTKLEEELRNR